ncbi:uncharacterized protein LOC107883927 [Acyrthosiphon pisum]|uniref:MULE transposase domain-containing protein n=1 Tax=Acyrthosiphon pisum TaxID=7029 RepID=A0A8R2D457_ACYPI|nr:uncharacterized protein LOC107883927 [Acyrthosiphon pisum]XP_029341967.1 uncharacterized protein LOC107883927 [Acyrthosiphon pisum]XP_029341971.1 uncharacterized protein LOC107883927 [Acyrthosiphon pisum]|eukprot:XP_016660420.1 PREDICTED: uncharacterized protein LOC107883927 [Acyrthosiphon pisum]
MKKIQKSIFPPTPKNLNHLNNLLLLENNRHFTMTFQTPESLFYQGPLTVNGTIVGVLFCNIKYIENIKNELKNVIIAGCDGTFKTVPKTIDGDCYQLFTFHIIYKNISFPMVYALLTGKTEIIYKELFQYVRNVLPLQYDKLTIITDYEISQINSIELVFPESTHQGCYFHYCQSILRHMRNKQIQIYNLVKVNPIAARIFRMILALPYLPSDRNSSIPSMLDGFNAIIIYTVQHQEVENAFHSKIS